MAQLRIERVNSLPVTRTASTIYFVKGIDADLVDIYLTGSDAAEIRHVISKTEISSMISAAISSASGILLVNDIDERDDLLLSGNAFVLVLDATGDPTVASGAALYFFDAIGDVWYKVSEFESMDVTLEWSAISGRPDSTPAQIDAAVANSHTHANKTVLDALGDDSGVLTYNGDEIGNSIAVAEW